MATPVVTPGSQSSENALAKITAGIGAALVLAGVALQVFHPVQDLGLQLIHYGVLLVGGSATVYGGFRTVLKVAAVMKTYEPEANAVAALIPGQTGSDARKALEVAEKLIDAVSAIQVAQTTAPATAALAAAVAAPVAPASSPVAPGAA